MEQLAVWAERLEGFVRVGTLWFERGGEEWFEYDGPYLQRGDATPIYPSLSLGGGRIDHAYSQGGFAVISQPDAQRGRLSRGESAVVVAV